MVIQPLVGNPYNGYINPYYWVDDHPLLYGNDGSLDPSTFTTGAQPAHLVEPSDFWWGIFGPGESVGPGRVIPKPPYLLLTYIWAIYNNLSRRLVTPNVGEKSGKCPPKWP